MDSSLDLAITAANNNADSSLNGGDGHFHFFYKKKGAAAGLMDGLNALNQSEGQQPSTRG